MGGNGQLLATQLLEVAVLMAWTCLLMGILFYAARRLGYIRVSAQVYNPVLICFSALDPFM
jgi:hypothetical protein